MQFHLWPYPSVVHDSCTRSTAGLSKVACNFNSRLQDRYFVLSLESHMVIDDRCAHPAPPVASHTYFIQACSFYAVSSSYYIRPPGGRRRRSFTKDDCVGLGVFHNERGNPASYFMRPSLDTCYIGSFLRSVWRDMWSRGSVEHQVLYSMNLY